MCRQGRRGQAIVETTIVLLVLAVAFAMIVQFADDLRGKLLAEYAALRVTRARTVGYNDYKLLKTARLAMASGSGACLTKDEGGHWLTTAGILNRMSHYLGCRLESQADNILDFSYWQNGGTHVDEPLLTGSLLECTVRQRRKRFFDWTSWLEGISAIEADDEDSETETSGTAALEAHYPLYLE